MPATNAISLRELRTTAPGQTGGQAGGQVGGQASGQAGRPAGPGRAGRRVLRGLSLDVPQGEAVVLVGRPGSGKTAALHATCGLLDLASGRVLAEARDVTALPPHRRGLPLVASGRAIRGMGMIGSGTVEAAVRLASRGLDVRPILEATMLSAEARRPLAALSPSAVRRVALAQAVASSPICLLLDEPARGLDPMQAGELFAAIRAVREAGMAMLVATSDVRTAMALAERAVVMVDGAARQAGWLRELHDSPADDATAGLLGEVNRLPGRVVAEEDDIVTVRLECGPTVEARREDVPVGANCVVCVRPGRIALAAVTAEIMGPGALSGRIRGQRFFGDLVWLDLEIGTERGRPPVSLGVVRPAVVPGKLAVGDTVAVAWQPHHAMAFRPMRGE